uniref:NADH-ubiquinone oxidoreductase chain 4 n=1 Tax=Homologenus malayensis TaxID=1505608 RepID=A0A0A7CD25_9EUCA|nr:NADH dehydrogenase subunit 4 [Homologenus malayensis]AIB52336.1 NADH dehydrogenase subunit 4 [Homologenus malayensis]
MLKFIIPTLMLVKFISDWGFIQVSLFVISFLVGLNCFYDYSYFCLGLCLGMDFLSYILIFLSVWIISLILLSSQKINSNDHFVLNFLFVNILLLLSLIITFCSMDYLLFYISFEMSLIPTLILILGWGYQPERLQAGIYMLFYTLFLSLPLLVSLLSFYNFNGSLTLGVVKAIHEVYFVDSIWYFSTILAFMVKLPVYLFHLWLPKAHVEAPMAGSMILAGVLLKLGGYGLIRVLVLFRHISLSFTWLWIGLSLSGSIIISLMCLRQVDMESLIAYSSVSHMGLVLCGLMMYNWWGLSGAVLVMVGHGLCSSGLFCLANMVYERVGSRSLLVSKGLLNFMPSMGLWWFLLSVSNMAAPPSLNLLGEISLIMGIISWSKLTMLLIMLVSFFSAAYTLYMYSLSQHGKFLNSLYSVCSGKVNEFLSLSLHWIPLNIIILKGLVSVPSLL